MSKELERKKDALIKSMEKKFGANVLRPASIIQTYTKEKISTGSISLDIALNGGYPLGKFIQIRGHYSASKSTMAYHAIREFQNYFKKHKIECYVALIQGESGSYTEDYGELIGIDNDNLIINECASLEEGLEVARQLQEQEVAKLIVFDSFASFVPMKEQDSSMDDSVQMGLKPKMFDEYCRKYLAINNKITREGKTPCTVIGLNQLREKIGSYGNPEYSPGGRALDFTASLNINIRRGDWITEGTGENKEIIGQVVKFKIDKSKVCVPYKTGEFDLYLQDNSITKQGNIDNFKELIIEAIAFGVIVRGGAWYSYKDDFKVQGADKVIELLRENLELFERIKIETLAISKDDSFVEEDESVEEISVIGFEEEKEKPKKKTTLKRKK